MLYWIVDKNMVVKAVEHTAAEALVLKFRLYPTLRVFDSVGKEFKRA